MLGRPVVGGITLPRPSRYDVQADPVASSVTLASGASAEYHLGHRFRFTLGWDALTVAEAGAVLRLGMLRGAFGYVDLDGTSYAVKVDTFDGVSAIAGTEPVRYRSGITMREDAPRLAAPAIPPPVTGPGTGDPGGGEEPPEGMYGTVDPLDGNVLDVTNATVDPTDAGVLAVTTGPTMAPDPAAGDVLVWVTA